MTTDGHLFPVSAKPARDYILPHNTFGPMFEVFKDISIKKCYFQQPIVVSGPSPAKSCKYP